MAVAFALTALVPMASAQSVASADPSTVKSGPYKVDPLHTQIAFSISHFGFTDFSGFFSGASGRLVLNTADPAQSRLDIEIPVETVLSTVPALDSQLKGAQWFDVAKYPTARFVSTKITRTGPTTATIDGDFTLHGVTRPIALEAHLVGAGTNPLDKAFTAGFQAVGTIKRSDFGIKQYLPLLGDDVALTISGAFELQS